LIIKVIILLIGISAQHILKVQMRSLLFSFQITLKLTAAVVCFGYSLFASSYFY